MAFFGVWSIQKQGVEGEDCNDLSNCKTTKYFYKEF
jgi:hypothetical protein